MDGELGGEMDQGMTLTELGQWWVHVMGLAHAQCHKIRLCDAAGFPRGTSLRSWFQFSESEQESLFEAYQELFSEEEQHSREEGE